MKIISNKKYKKITDEKDISNNEYKLCQRNFNKYIKAIEKKEQLINDKLVELLQSKKQSKDKIFKKIEEIYRLNRGE